ncbi:hypothetical protein SLA2020_275190 [Shorea laevis]
MERNRKKAAEKNDEVEELLQAAQDELLLKLSLDSHMSRLTPDYISSDLDRRFQALKSRPSAPLTLLLILYLLPKTRRNQRQDEVEKLIQWAKDAARLEPSPSSDDEDEDDDDHAQGHPRK